MHFKEKFELSIQPPGFQWPELLSGARAGWAATLFISALCPEVVDKKTKKIFRCIKKETNNETDNYVTQSCWQVGDRFSYLWGVRNTRSLLLKTHVPSNTELEGVPTPSRGEGWQPETSYFLVTVRKKRDIDKSNFFTCHRHHMKPITWNHAVCVIFHRN